MDKRQGFWPVYEMMNKLDKLYVFDLMVKVAREVGEPYEQPKRGRKHKLSACEEGAVVLFYMSYDYTQRELGVDSEFFFGVRIDHTTIPHYMDRIPNEWLMEVCELVDHKVDSFDDGCVGIADSTEYSTGAYKSVKRVLKED